MFVETQTPEERYTAIAGWLQLGPLVEVQKNLRLLRSQVKSAAEDITAVQRVDGQLARETANALAEWDEGKIVDYANVFVLAPLDRTLVLQRLDAFDPAYVELINRANAEERQVGLAALRQIRQAAVALWNETLVEEDGETVVTGAIRAFETAADCLSRAAKVESDERGKAASAAFQALWKAAEPLFADDGLAPEACPICATPIGETSAGSCAGVRAHLAKHLEELADFAKAKRALDDARIATETLM